MKKLAIVLAVAVCVSLLGAVVVSATTNNADVSETESIKEVAEVTEEADCVIVDDLETQLMLRDAAVFGFCETTFYMGWSEPESAYYYMTYGNDVVANIEIDDSAVNYEEPGTYPVTYTVTISRDKWIENRDVIISTCADPVKSQGYDYVYNTVLDNLVNENSSECVNLKAASTVVVVDKMPWE